MLRFLADENVAPRVVENLRKEGFDVASIFERKLTRGSDEKILKIGKQEKRVILTHDKDFGNLIRQPYLTHGGVMGYFNKIKKSVTRECNSSFNSIP